MQYTICFLWANFTFYEQEHKNLFLSNGAMNTLKVLKILKKLNAVMDKRFDSQKALYSEAWQFCESGADGWIVYTNKKQMRYIKTCKGYI